MMSKALVLLYLVFPFKFFCCSILFLSLNSAPTQLSPSLSHSLPIPNPLHCLQLICIVAKRVGQAVIVIVVMAEGFSHQLLLLLRLNQNTSVLVMSWPRNYSKLLPWETPYQEVQTIFSPP